MPAGYNPDCDEFGPHLLEDGSVEWPNKPFQDNQKVESLEQLIAWCNVKPYVASMAIDAIAFYIYGDEGYIHFKVPPSRLSMVIWKDHLTYRIRWTGYTIQVRGKVEAV